MRDVTSPETNRKRMTVALNFNYYDYPLSQRGHQRAKSVNIDEKEGLMSKKQLKKLLKKAKGKKKDGVVMSSDIDPQLFILKKKKKIKKPKSLKPKDQPIQNKAFSGDNPYLNIIEKIEEIESSKISIGEDNEVVRQESKCGIMMMKSCKMLEIGDKCTMC